ncbi:hypothetical protein ACS0TY_017551 [Phlomoides rotata]
MGDGVVVKNGERGCDLFRIKKREGDAAGGYDGGSGDAAIGGWGWGGGGGGGDIEGSGGGIVQPAIGFPQVVWSANRNNPVRINAKLELTGGGDLVLQDSDGTLAWSTNTSGRSVVGLNLTNLGNLVLFDAKNSVVWQSFDHPTDALVPGQILVSGMNLTASDSLTNWTNGGLFSLSISDTSFVASMQSDPLQIYYQKTFPRTKPNVQTTYAKYGNGSLDFYVNRVEPQTPDTSITFPHSDAQYMKLGPDGHLRVYQWGGSWTEVDDILTDYRGGCQYPMVCGRYGICSNGQCSCPNGARQKIIYLDIKPQNILLDEHHNAKLADFGLAKLIDRDQSQVVTTMRGTPGYLTPEWLSAVIAEKVDVYSFGVVILEMVSGRKIFEQSRPEEERYILTHFKNKAEQGEWLDLVDKCYLDVESNVGEIIKMLKVSSWCLQSDHEKRPSMSMVIKVLEGVMDVEIDIDYNFLIPQYLVSRIPEVRSLDVTPLLPSVLSGPR